MVSSLSALRARVAHLERRSAEAVGQVAASAQALGALAIAVAISVGGYPRPSAEPYGFRDGYGDAFARALGYADRDALDAPDLEGDDGWTPRVERALAALCEPDGQGAAPVTAERLIRACAAVFAASPDAELDRNREGLSAWARAEGIDLGSAVLPPRPDP